MKRTILAVALAVIFVMALAVPAFAQMTHFKQVEADGVYDWEIQAGHLCNTGAELKQTIMGSGELSKVMTVAMIPGRLVVDDVNDFVAGATALTITSVIELCAPPKYTYEDDANITGDYVEAPVATTAMYPPADGWRIPGFYGTGNVLTGMNMGDFADFMGWEAVSDQIWAAQVQADPGFSGSLHQDFVASEGVYTGAPRFDSDVTSIGKDRHGHWGWQDTTDSSWGRILGKNYVGSYFEIDQFARTSMGEVKRFIDISSPWSHAYVYEDMSIVGKSEISESFAMNNLAAGADLVGLWYDLF